MQPFWNSTTMYGESILLVRNGATGAAQAPLLFTPREILLAQSASGEVTYEPGRDYVFDAQAGMLVAPPGSRMPAQTWESLTPPLGSQPYSLTRRDGAGDILFGASHEYHDMQAAISYTHAGDEWRGPAPRFAGEQLPAAWHKLRNGEPLRLALLGDSISTGCNASKWANTPPQQPFYGELFAEALQGTYGAPVALANFSVGGMDSAWGAQNTATVIDAAPDLAILAFGMNDSTGGCPAAQYIANLREQMTLIRAGLPRAEFILVASMLPNADWHLAKPELVLEYREALLPLAGEGVAVADVTGVWAELMKRKRHLDLTGNGVNHPNDFGHRVYADVLAALLVGGADSAAL